MLRIAQNNSWPSLLLPSSAATKALRAFRPLYHISQNRYLRIRGRDGIYGSVEDVGEQQGFIWKHIPINLPVVPATQDHSEVILDRSLHAARDDEFKLRNANGALEIGSELLGAQPKNTRVGHDGATDSSSSSVTQGDGDCENFGELLENSADSGPSKKTRIRYYSYKDYRNCSWKSLRVPSQAESLKLDLNNITAKLINHAQETARSKKPLKSHVDNVDAHKKEPSLDLSVLNYVEISYLRKSGYTRADVELWAQILLEKDTLEAARKFRNRTVTSAKDDQASESNDAPLPSFVLLSLLRRDSLSASEFQVLLITVWHHLSEKMYHRRWLVEVGKRSLVASAALLDALVFEFFEQLLPRARQLLPEAIVNIAAVLYTYLSWFSVRENYPPGFDPTPAERSRLTFLFNRAISLLSNPTDIDPMKSSAILERAQFDILASMVQRRPRIELSLEGWRGVVAVMLRRPKSEQDRRWAELKSAAWPPFMEPRTGLDEDLTPDDGASRAKTALKKMLEAGYSPSKWEDVATILSGWDTDQSPTIQTRSIQHVRSDTRTSEVWAARVTATRTVLEAWACFLSCEEEYGQVTQMVYEAMLEKLIYDDIRQRSEGDEESSNTSIPNMPLPGDGKEVRAEPISPADAVYTSRKPPSAESLFHRMLADGIEPREQLLAMLLNSASSLAMGVKLMQSCVKAYNGIVPKLLSIDLLSKEDFELSGVQPYILSSVIGLLCKPWSEEDLKALQGYGGTTSVVSSWQTGASRPLLHASRLMEILKPQYRPCWNHLLSNLANDSLEHSSEDLPMTVSDSRKAILAATTARGVIARMRTLPLELDFLGFYHLCVCLEKAAIGARTLLGNEGVTKSDARINALWSANETNASLWSQPLDDGLQSSKEHHILDEGRSILSSGSQYLRKTFQDLVGTTSKDVPFALPVDGVPPIARLLAIPRPAHLHAYVRALGLLGDHEGILSLAQWMRVYSEELNASASEEFGGRRRMRNVLIAMRLFLERPATDPNLKYSSIYLLRADGDLVELVAREINAVEEWGSWPTFKELKAYCK